MGLRSIQDMQTLFDRNMKPYIILNLINSTDLIKELSDQPLIRIRFDGQEQVPETFGLGLGLQGLNHRVHYPCLFLLRVGIHL